MDVGSGKEELKKMCWFQAMPIFFTETLRASNRPAAAIESTRNEISRGFQHLTEAVLRLPYDEDKS